MSRSWPWFALAAAIVAADQLTKALVLAAFEPGERLALTPFLNLVLAFNKGAAFSLLAQAPGWQTPVLIAIALAAVAILSVLIVRNPGRRLLCTGLALVLGGALGNLIDRLRVGHVVEFVDLLAAGWHWPAFNVADSAITVGAVLLILEGFVGHEGRARAAS
ncbi:MAG: signal peptidase II [Betaproteobacteria bacterium]